MGYTINDSICRVVLFKKIEERYIFHCNIAVPFNGNFSDSMKEFLSSASRKIDQTLLDWNNVYAVCFEPYLINCPVMLNIGNLMKDMESK